MYDPDVLSCNDENPTDVLCWPLLVLFNAYTPIAVLKLPILLIELGIVVNAL